MPCIGGAKLLFLAQSGRFVHTQTSLHTNAQLEPPKLGALALPPTFYFKLPFGMNHLGLPRKPNKIVITILDVQHDLGRNCGQPKVTHTILQKAQCDTSKSGAGAVFTGRTPERTPCWTDTLTSSGRGSYPARTATNSPTPQRRP